MPVRLLYCHIKKCIQLKRLQHSFALSFVLFYSFVEINCYDNNSRIDFQAYMYCADHVESNMNNISKFSVALTLISCLGTLTYASIAQLQLYLLKV
jgi:hypothetical protein